MDYIFDFQLEFDGFSPDTFRLTYLDCQNDGLSQNYCFTLRCFSDQSVDVSQWGLKKAVIYHDNKPFRYGVLTSGKAYEKDFEGFFYEFQLSSPLALLLTTGPERVFLAKTVNHIIDEVLQSAGWHASQWRWDLNKSLPVLDFRVQYHQSDYDFVMELFAEYKLHFIFDQHVLKISDFLQGKNYTHHVETPQPYYFQEIADFLGYDFEPAKKAELMTATIESLNPDEVHINHDGYYRMRLLWDKNSKNTEGSKPVPLVLPHFMHFPLKARTEVAVRFLNGNINQPILMGVIPEHSPEPNVYLHKSYAGHGLEFTSEKIKLVHGNQKNYINLHKNTEILCQNGNIHCQAAENILHTSDGNIQQTLQQDLRITVTQDHIVETKTGDITLHAKSIITCSAENTLQFKSTVFKLAASESHFVAKNIVFENRHEISLNSSTVNVFSSHLNFQGNFTMTAGEVRIIGTGGNMMFNTPVLRVNAQQITGLVMAPGY